ncbi:hypothetical protein HYPBUDRAFT_159279 [Hyphopichia burtonii NRRL Y-1933]|uniref:Zn(2)-C6 fungal-type domain-containing protein n=1 Tax=Hyphopichia burtonii NRRL Y-1933 TaxID=984485 RepID=A0A1E4RQM1_9ASCO|nr:hypothetical protein HYPBUDRAFT_159279 [Hyphopichia burtonii NRRL Y-1933]ODV69365.1 hypothetical protein HYPBUDRAFT_159279 [Hyphopichia burtonii NRRL Y-1933]
MVKLEDPNGSSNDKNKPKAFTIKYKRPRGLRACVVCRQRKVRCNIDTNVPCLNCVTFGCECILPEPKKRGNASGKSKNKKQKTESDIKNESNNELKIDHSNENSKLESPKIPDTVKKDNNTTITSTSEPVLNISQESVPPSLTSNYKTRPSIHKSRVNSINSKPNLTFLGSSSISLVAQKVGQNHISLAEDIFDVTESSLDLVELEILKLRGAFLLPSKDLATNLVNSYFEHVHPLMPVINRTEFMSKFNDPKDNPSLMLLQAVLLCGCRVSQNPLVLDSKGSNNLACLTFFRRAKALYETNYESDPVSIIQTVILIGSYWEGPEDVTRNSFYWTRVAVSLAQGFGFQRDINNAPDLSSSEKKIWRRIWWCLFEKDRNVAIAFGRPNVIDLNDCDVPMLTLDDFNEDDPELGIVSPYPVNETQALYFIHLVKLAEITGIIIKHQYTVKSELMKRKNKFSIIQHCDMLMGIWFTNLPPQLVFSLTDSSTQNFYSSLLNAQYYNRLYLIHRANLLRMARSSSNNPNNYKYPSWGISFQAARMISIVLKILLDRGQLIYCPAMFVYILFSALMMLIYHVDSPNQIIASTASDSLFISRAVMKELTVYWPIARILMRLFDKYANDKFKRAKVIENGNRIAELEELNANKNSFKSNDNLNQFYNKDLKSKSEVASTNYDPSKDYNSPNAISPNTKNITNGNTNEHSHSENNQRPLYKRTRSKSKNQKEKKTKSSDTSPSSTNSFPDISLVTESIPANQNFFDNFEPTQLFPNVNFSIPPTRSQSPALNQSTNLNQNETNDIIDAANESIAAENNNQSNTNPLTFGNNLMGTTANVPSTPGEAFNTNFIDASFINMNMPPLNEGSVTDDVSSLFNFQI